MNKRRWREIEDLLAELYQVAGGLLIGVTLEHPDYTAGQVDRLKSLLLDVLADPGRYDAELVRKLRDQAVEP